MMVHFLVLMVNRPSTAGLMLTSVEHVPFLLLAFITYYDVCELDQYHYIDVGCLRHIFCTTSVYMCCNKNHIIIFIKYYIILRYFSQLICVVQVIYKS